MNVAVIAALAIAAGVIGVVVFSGALFSLAPPEGDFAVDFTVEEQSTKRVYQFSTQTVGVSYTWDFGDGTPKDGHTTVMHQFAAAGTYTVTLTVVDGDGRAGFAQKEVIVP